MHCVAGIVLVAALGLGGQWLLAPEIHEVGLALAILVGALTIGVGVWRHGQVGPLLLGGAGLGMMAFALLVPHGVGEAALTVAGVACVATAHVINLRLHAL